MNYEVTRGQRFQHYKGGIYKIVCLATHTEEIYPLIIYMGEDNRTWARPAEKFFGGVTVDGYYKKRFVELEEE